MQIFIFIFACLCIITTHKFLVHPNLVPSQALHSPLSTSTSSQESITPQSGVTAGVKQWVRLDAVPQLLVIQCSQNDPIRENLLRKVLRLICFFLTKPRYGAAIPKWEGAERDDELLETGRIPNIRVLSCYLQFVPDTCWYPWVHGWEELEELAGESQPRRPSAATQPGPSPTPRPGPVCGVSSLSGRFSPKRLFDSDWIRQSQPHCMCMQRRKLVGDVFVEQS